MLVGSAEVSGDGCLQGGCWGGCDWVLELVLWKQSPEGGSSGGATCPHISHLLAGCLGLAIPLLLTWTFSSVPPVKFSVLSPH